MRATKLYFTVKPEKVDEMNQYNMKGLEENGLDFLINNQPKLIFRPTLVCAYKKNLDPMFLPNFGYKTVEGLKEFYNTHKSKLNVIDDNTNIISEDAFTTFLEETVPDGERLYNYIQPFFTNDGSGHSFMSIEVSTSAIDGFYASLSEYIKMRQIINRYPVEA